MESPEYKEVFDGSLLGTELESAKEDFVKSAEDGDKDAEVRNRSKLLFRKEFKLWINEKIEAAKSATVYINTHEESLNVDQ